ncbi:uncharacterized protein LOC114843573 isoform X2 [Betta splendens]|uniref:Uncharacterized protein LOC114843573 isoform X2 n=1 Tax=Betta splendens TaxID=158456 RepID=A0A9W2XC89_BETSP|nr:uncharacterized protein LOC114843573 isoform X2 [Betta splendens]
MDLVWLYSLSQCILSVLVVVVSVRLCVAIRGNKSVSDVQEQPDGSRLLPGSVSCCLRLCLGWLGAVGGAVEVPVNVLLNLRTPQCLYTCITMVCCPLLVRQFTMFLTVLLTLDAHLQHRLADRYSSVVTRQRTLCVVLLCWVASVLCSFAQFIGSGVFDARRDAGAGSGTAGLGVDGNWTASSPDPAPFPTSSTNLPTWVHAVAQFLFQMYSVVPQILFTPPHKKPKEKQAFPLSIPNLPPAAKHSLKAKVCPEV